MKVSFHTASQKYTSHTERVRAGVTSTCNGAKQ